MKKFTLLTGFLFLMFPFFGKSQCTTSNATSCVCEASGSTDCDLLPDIIVGRPPLLVSGNNGVIEYSQSGNGANDGRLRVSVSSPNIGHGPLEIHTTNTYICGTDTITGTAPATCPNTGLPPRQLITQRVYHKTGSTMTYYDRDAGSMTYHPTHGHMHVDDWGIYTLRTQSTDPNPLNWPIIGTGAKLAFCLMDYGSCSTYSGHCVDSLGNTLLNSNFPNYGLGGGSYSCSQSVQGISSGYTDIYYQYLDGMYIDIPPGTCNGNYYIVVQLDPYDYFLEENENNNVIVVPYTLTQQVLSSNATISASSSGPICSSGNITLSANSGSGFTYLWSNGETTQNITVSTPGNYVVTVTTPCGSAVSQPYAVTLIDIPPQTTSLAVCDQGSVNLSANAGGGVIDWFDVPSGGSSLFTGNVFTTPVVNTTTTYYAQATTTAPGFSAYAQPNANTIGSGGFLTSSQYLIFDAVQSFTLNSVKVYAQTATSTTVELRSSTGALLNSATVSIPSGESRITLNWNIAPGSDYRLTRAGSAGLYRNNGGVSYPYNITNYLSITGSSAGASFYYFFYDWEISVASQVCVSNRIPATVTVNPNPVVTFNTVNGVCINAPSVILTGGLPAGGTYSGPGVSGNTFDPSVAGVGVHLITYTYTDTHGCSGSSSQNIEVYALPIVTLNTFAAVCTTDVAFALTGGSPAGGVYSGTGVNGNMFDPTAAGIGNFAITYSYTDGNGCSASAIQSIVVNDCGGCLPPAKPSTLTGPEKLCAGTNEVYSIAAVNGATSYLWTVPAGCNIISGQGTTTITVEPTLAFSYGSVCVSAVNSCGPSAARCKNISKLNARTPSPIVGGLFGHCQAVVTLSVPPVVGAVSYDWTIPAGCVIISGQGTNSITFSTPAGFNSGNVCVTASNGCAVSNSRCAKIYGAPARPLMGGPNFGCVGQVDTYFASPVYNANTYIWTVPAGSIVVNGQGTTTVDVEHGTKSGFIRCYATNDCGDHGAGHIRVDIVCRMAGTDLSDYFDVHVQPNPATEQTMLMVDGAADDNVWIRITNMLGQEVYSAQRSVNDNEGIILDLSTVMKGIYFVTVSSSEQSKSVKLIIE